MWGLLSLLPHSNRICSEHGSEDIALLEDEGIAFITSGIFYMSPRGKVGSSSGLYGIFSILEASVVRVRSRARHHPRFGTPVVCASVHFIDITVLTLIQSYGVVRRADPDRWSLLHLWK